MVIVGRLVVMTALFPSVPTAIISGKCNSVTGCSCWGCSGPDQLVTLKKIFIDC